MKGFIIRIVPVALIAVAGNWGWGYFSSYEAEKKQRKKGKVTKAAQKKGAVPKSARKNMRRGLQVSAEPFALSDYQVHLKTQGVVSASNSTNLTPLVSGRVTEIGKNFENGAFIEKGELLVQLETDDLEAAVISAEAALARSQANLAQEVARGKQALRNWKDIGFKEEPNDLVLRKPQLKEAQANVKSSKSALERAKRNLNRATVVAPYSGRIQSRDVGIGQSVSGNTKLGEIFSTDYVEVRLPLSTRQLQLVGYNRLLNAKVQLSNALIEDESEAWHGTVVRTEGALDASSRELFVIVRVNDPFGIKNDHPPLFLNQPVNASIEANVIKNVYKISRDYVRELRDLLIVKNGRLDRITVSPVWEDAGHLIVKGQIPKDASLVTSKLSFAPIGAKVTVLTDELESDNPTLSGDTKPKPGEKAKPKKPAKDANKSKDAKKSGATQVSVTPRI